MFKKGTLASGSASLICFFQVLDHLPDPMDFLRAVFDILEPGGVAVCVTHDTSALTAKILGEASPIYDIEHTYLFNRKNLAQAFQKAGFAGAETFPIANDYALRYWLNMAPLPRPLKERMQQAVEGTSFGKMRLRLYLGNMGIVAQKARA